MSGVIKCNQGALLALNVLCIKSTPRYASMPATYGWHSYRRSALHTLPHSVLLTCHGRSSICILLLRWPPELMCDHLTCERSSELRSNWADFSSRPAQAMEWCPIAQQREVLPLPLCKGQQILLICQLNIDRSRYSHQFQLHTLKKDCANLHPYQAGLSCPHTK